MIDSGTKGSFTNFQTGDGLEWVFYSHAYVHDPLAMILVASSSKE